MPLVGKRKDPIQGKARPTTGLMGLEEEEEAEDAAWARWARSPRHTWAPRLN